MDSQPLVTLLITDQTQKEKGRVAERVVVGVTLQSNCKFSSHVKVKLVQAKMCLHILRTLRNEQYKQNEIDLFFSDHCITGCEIAPNTGANATKFFTLATKS